MDNIYKLTFYYEPSRKNKRGVRSYTLTFSQIDEETDTYKQKAILQYWSNSRGVVEEYKMKEFHVGVKQLIEKINKIDFNKQYSNPTLDGEKMYIYYKDKQILVGDMSEIQDVLNIFNFFNLYKISHKHYDTIKDMNEYTKLKSALYKKAESLTIKEQALLDGLFKRNNPYITFQSIPFLQNYLNSQEDKI